MQLSNSKKSLCRLLSLIAIGHFAATLAVLSDMSRQYAGARRSLGLGEIACRAVEVNERAESKPRLREMPLRRLVAILFIIVHLYLIL